MFDRASRFASATGSFANTADRGQSISTPRQSPSLVFCVLMDAIGYFSYAIPILGEFGDLVWAPISAIIFTVSFGGWKGILGGAFNFLEEILPGTDFIPSFTIAWFLKNRKQRNKR